MPSPDIVTYRLYNQGLSNPSFKDPAEAVMTLGAVQAQDYAGARWGLGQRIRGATDAAIETAFNQGHILRTHVLRPTWHFVAPQDIHWILMLTAPRVHAVNASMYRRLELDAGVFKRSRAALKKALRDGQYLTRAELTSRLKAAGISARDPLRFTYLIMRAELDGLICSGPRRGKQFTYALLEQRAPQKTGHMSRAEALAELTRRYFATRGPATLSDFSWWSGLTMADARQGIEMVRPAFTSEVINGQLYWFAASRPAQPARTPTAHLLPNYDEYFIGFKDRSAIGAVARKANLSQADPALIGNVIILDGQIVGGWKRTLKKDAVIVASNLITRLTGAGQRAVAAAVGELGAFLGRSATLIKEAQ